MSFLLVAAACASAEPDWGAEHAADPSAPTGAEVDVTGALREVPDAPEGAPEGGGHHGHGAPAPVADGEPAAATQEPPVDREEPGHGPAAEEESHHAH